MLINQSINQCVGLTFLCSTTPWWWHPTAKIWSFNHCYESYFIKHVCWWM